MNSIWWVLLKGLPLRASWHKLARISAIRRHGTSSLLRKIYDDKCRKKSKLHQRELNLFFRVSIPANSEGSIARNGFWGSFLRGLNL